MKSGVGAKNTIIELKNEKVNLQLCYKCAELIEQLKRSQFATSEFKLPRPADRVNRVIRFMENYFDKGLSYM